MEKFTAKQASELAIINEPKIDNILTTIKSVSECGQRFLMQPNISDNNILELIKLGFSVSEIIDPFGNEQTKIKW